MQLVVQSLQQVAVRAATAAPLGAPQQRWLLAAGQLADMVQRLPH